MTSLSLLPVDDVEPFAATPRVRHLLQVARRLFVSEGFAATSIDGVARESGVSKETIYRYFANKQALFCAALEDVGGDFTRRADALHGPDGAGEAGLSEFALEILESAVSSGFLNPTRVAIEISVSMPEFSRELYARPWTSLEPLRLALQDIARAAIPNIEVPFNFATAFGTLAVQSPRLLMGFDPPPADERVQHADAAAALFEHGALALGFAPDASGARAEPLPARESHVVRLLEVAARHFLQDGVDGANLERIAARAKVGRGTLYRHFGSKDGLVNAAMRDAAARVARVPEMRLPSGVASSAALSGFLAEALRALGSPQALAVQRTAIAEARRNPALAREVYRHTRAAWIAPLARWFASLNPALGKRGSNWTAAQALALAHRGTRIFSVPCDEASMSDQADRAAIIMLEGFVAALDVKARKGKA